MNKNKTIAAPKSLKVLFIGNSFTARNNVPGLIAELAVERGLRFEHQTIQAGGASLRQHLNKGDALRIIESVRFDYVVLQEQSTLPIKNAARMHESIRMFDAAIKAAGAKTALYLTWARQNVPETQAAITDAYNSIGAELGATVIPAGTAWQLFLLQQAHPVLHDKDLSHPTLAGSYLAACVFFAVLFGQSPFGVKSELKGLTPADIAALQTTAWAVVQG